MAQAVQSLRLGRGTIGKCKISKAVKIAMENRFIMAGTEPNLLQKAFMLALGSPLMYLLPPGGLIAFLFEPSVNCPPELAELAPGEVRPEWDDKLYVNDGHCGTLCEADEPVSCFDGAQACWGLYYVGDDDASSPADYSLQNLPGSEGQDTVEVKCTTTRLGAAQEAIQPAELKLCCPESTLGGVPCNRLYSLADD